MRWTSDRAEVSMGMIGTMPQMPRSAPSIAAFYHITFLPSSATEADAAQWYRRQVSNPGYTPVVVLYTVQLFSVQLYTSSISSSSSKESRESEPPLSLSSFRVKYVSKNIDGWRLLLTLLDTHHSHKVCPQRCLTHTATGNGRPVLDTATYREFESHKGKRPRAAKNARDSTEGNAVITRHASTRDVGHVHT